MLGVAYIRFGITGQLCYNVYEIKFFINDRLSSQEQQNQQKNL